ncbi:MAG: hypothetical protein ACOZQL_00280 [Myxococcota bacterium]
MTFRLALILGVLSTTAAAQRVSFPNFSGPGANTVRNQLVGAVCETADCVAATKTTTGGKPDWKKAKKEAVAFFVTGNVVKKGKALTLELQVLNKAGPAKAKKSWPLDKSGTLPAKSLQSAMELLSQAFGTEAASRPAEPTPEPVRAAPKETPPVEKRVTPPPEERAEKRPPREEEPAPEPVKPSKRGKRAPKFLVVDVGADVLTRKLEYAQVATANLRRYELLTPVGMPVVDLKFYPLALVRDDLLAGLGVEVGFGFAPWIQSRLASITEPFPTSMMRFDGLVRFDLAPIDSFALTISPYVGVRNQSFTVSPLADGRRLDGLPNISFLGLRAGLGLEVPIIPDRLSVFGRFGIIPVFGSGEILSSAFFPNGSAFGLEANAGVGVGLLPFLSIRASFEFSNYGLTFKTQPTDTYVATGANDLYLGGNASLRFAF